MTAGEFCEPAMARRKLQNGPEVHITGPGDPSQLAIAGAAFVQLSR